MVHMISMKRTQNEKKEMDRALGEPSPSKGPEGPSIHFDKHHLKKLGIEELPKVGTKMKIHGHAEITSRHESDYGSGEDKGVSCCITHMHKPQMMNSGKKIPEGENQGKEGTEKEGDRMEDVKSAYDTVTKRAEERESLKKAVKEKGKKIPEKKEEKRERKEEKTEA